MSQNIIRVHLATGTTIIVAFRDREEDAEALVTTLNTHAVGYRFQAVAA